MQKSDLNNTANKLYCATSILQIQPNKHSPWPSPRHAQASKRVRNQVPFWSLRSMIQGMAKRIEFNSFW